MTDKGAKGTGTAQASAARVRGVGRTALGIGLASLFSGTIHETATVLLPAFLVSPRVAAGALRTIEGLADGFSSLTNLDGGTPFGLIQHAPCPVLVVK